MNLLIASSDGTIFSSGFPSGASFKCAIGKGGMVPAADKREGDGASPIGKWPLRRVFYRPDRLDRILTGLPVTALTPSDGWCDDPADPAYNTKVTLPYGASHEKMWRDDHAYDVVVELGHNDSPPVAGLGSAIFIHVAKPGYTPTEGCIALAVEDLKALLKDATTDTVLEIRA